MFKQIRTTSNPKFKLALNKSSIRKMRFDASSGKENINPKCSVKPSGAKGRSVTGECSIQNMADEQIHRRSSGYFADVSSDSLYSELADSIMDDSIFQDCDEESSFEFEGICTSTPLSVNKRTSRFAFKSVEKYACLANETFDLSDHFEYHSMENAFDTTMYDIVANDSVELTKKRLPSIVSQDEDEESSCVLEGIVANDSVELTKKRLPSIVAQDEDEESSCVLEGIVANDSIELTRKRVPSSKAQSSDKDVESDFVVEDDNKFDADASSSFEEEAVFNIPTVIVSSPSDGDITSIVSPIVELDYMSIVDQGCKYFPLDGTLHNWNLRFNTGEIFPDHDLRGSGRIEAAGIQLLVSSPSDGDLWLENIVEKEFEVEDIMDHSYKHHLLDASLHNWNMRFNFDAYLRELQESDDVPYDEDEVY